MILKGEINPDSAQDREERRHMRRYSSIVRDL